MGAAQSVNYPGEQSSNASDNNLPIINLRETPMPTFQRGSMAANTSLQLQRALATKKNIVKSHFNALQKKLETALKLHLLFDNYENKNSVIIIDLDKKLVNQQKELKELKESNHKIKQLIEFDKDNIDQTSSTKKTIKYMTLGLSISLLVIIILILIKKGIINKFKPPTTPEF
jgi:hypothetical protein